ncbi:MAG: RidA family protein [Acidimicrobiales bacterium]|jgi:enamine deaminase RidA (YjgF/YER057c/UK114 family)
MRPRRITVGSLHARAPYAYATVAVPDDSLVFCAGACPIDESGRVAAPDDLEAQAKLAVSNLAAVLREAGCSLGDVLRTTVYVATSDHAELVRGWEAVRTEFEGVDPPSTLLGVSLLGYSGQRIEIEAIAAARPGD